MAMTLDEQLASKNPMLFPRLKTHRQQLRPSGRMEDTLPIGIDGEFIGPHPE